MPDEHKPFSEPVGPPSRQSPQAVTTGDADWLAKAVACTPDLTREQCRGLVAIVAEGGFTVRARQRIAFLTGDESWEPSAGEMLAVMAAAEAWETADYLARVLGD